MKEKKRIEEEVQKSMELLDQQESLPPDPYFYTRLRARIDSRNQQHRVLSLSLKPALLALLVMMNLGTAVWYLAGDSSSAEKSNRDTLIELLAEDISLDSKSSAVIDLE